MGYHTEFNGMFELDKKLDDATFDFLKALNKTRRMKRNVGPEFGVEGEFYVAGDGENDWFNDGKEKKASNIVDYNTPPSTQPGLWCQWVPTDDGLYIEWDGGEKFYNYVEWIEYIVKNILAPRGYKLNGEVYWNGEESGDIGKIVVKNNVVKALSGTYSYAQPRKRVKIKLTKLQEVAKLDKRISALKTKKKELLANG